MAGPVKDREALQRLSFLYQGPLSEEDPLSWLLFPPHPGPDLHPAPETHQDPQYQVQVQCGHFSLPRGRTFGPAAPDNPSQPLRRTPPILPFAD
ncbi:hypothetical protein CB1_001562005 [Camelus ferus]|nr:hypothetical protein CB1_001562005 [Camelus ferus]